jgi:hypothetical protein
MGTTVRLRQRIISGNRYSLYLDFYPSIPDPLTGKLTRREFLGYYLLSKPKTLGDKKYNKEALQIARKIKQKREKDLNMVQPRSGIEPTQKKVAKYEREGFMDMSYKARLWDSKLYSTDKKSLWDNIENFEEIISKEYLTVRDAAILLNCSVRSMHYYIRLKRIKAAYISKRIIRIKRSEIDKLFEYPKTL